MHIYAPILITGATVGIISTMASTTVSGLVTLRVSFSHSHKQSLFMCEAMR